MTRKSQLKARVRARMAATGESYVTALRHVAPSAVAAETADDLDHGYRLRGGVHPLSANVHHVLAHHGIAVTAEGGRPISEALVFGISGGVGAGYILWEFKQHGTATLTMAFENSWQYPDRWHEKTLRRLGVRYTAEHSGATVAASRRVVSLLERGTPCIVRPDRYHLGYWRMPAYLDGRGGPDLLAYAIDERGVWLDDRNVSPLVVTVPTLEAARARVGSYRNSLHVIEAASKPPSADALRDAVRAGLEDTIEHLSSGSDSFSLPAWRKWSRMLTDRTGAKAWPVVFADGENGLAGALISLWEHVMPAGGYGGHLRDLYAEFLEEASHLLERPQLRDVAATYRRAAAAWQDVAAAAIAPEVPALGRLRDLTIAVRQAVVDPDSIDSAEADAAAAELWSVREELDRSFPLDEGGRQELFGELSARVSAAYEVERAALEHLRDAVLIR